MIFGKDRSSDTDPLPRVSTIRSRPSELHPGLMRLAERITMSMSGCKPGSSEHLCIPAVRARVLPPQGAPWQALVSHDVHVRTLLPTVNLTPATTSTLQRLQHWHAAQRGVNWARERPLGEWTIPLDTARVAAHLGVPLPQIPALARRGCTTSVRGFKGVPSVFEHPVPRATAPPPARDARADRHSVLVLHVPPGVDAGEVMLEDDRPAGAGWAEIAWGGYTALPGDPGDDDPQMQAWEESRAVSWMRLRCPGSPPVHILRRWEEQTSASWRALAAGSLFDVTLVLPFAPLEAVSVLSEAATAARSQA